MKGETKAVSDATLHPELEQGDQCPERTHPEEKHPLDELGAEFGECSSLLQDEGVETTVHSLFDPLDLGSQLCRSLVELGIEPGEVEFVESFEVGVVLVSTLLNQSTSSSATP